MSLGVMTRSEYVGHWAAVAFAVVVLATSPRPLFAQGFSRVSVPVPVDIDGQAMRSQLYLKVEMKSIDQPFEQFAAGHPDKAGEMLVRAVQAVRKNDVAGFGSVWSPPDEMKSSAQSKAVKMSDNGPDAWVRLIRGMFDFDKLTVVAEIMAGPDTMFVWDSQTKNGVLRRVFYVGPDQRGRLRLSAPGDDKPIQILLLNALDAARTEPDSYKPLPNINLRYQYPIPLAGVAGSMAHPVFLEFDGTPMDFPTGNESVEAPSALLKFYRGAILASRNGRNEEFAASFTTKSAEKVQQWQSDMEKRKEAEKKNTAEKSPVVAPPTSTPPVSAPPASTRAGAAAIPPKGANVKFVLNADPVFLIFQAPGLGNDWLPAKLAYTYVVSEGGAFKMANFGFGNTLDEVLQDPALFDKRVLKPAPAKPGAQKTKVPPSSAKPAGARPGAKQ